jgi:hypothetical protein
VGNTALFLSRTDLIRKKAQNSYKNGNIDTKPILLDNVSVTFSGEETMPSKSAVIFLFVLLTIIPAYAALLEQPNSVPLDPNLLQHFIDKANKGNIENPNKKSKSQALLDAELWEAVGNFKDFNINSIKQALDAGAKGQIKFYKVL